MSILVLVGAPASGKSTVGELLAERLGVEFIDVDAAIEERTGKRIGEIFVDDGEPEFRRLEREATLALIQREAVVSLGGGAVLNPDIRAALADHRTCWLQISVTHATRRVGMNVMRPLLLGDVRKNLEKLLAEREPFYREVADITIDTTDLKPDEIVDQLVAEVSSAKEQQ
ncbi:shikimate kinase [Aestuariimicrobium sp. Y1814]|uniref:shikimate kinase n=1 Tax=Aestuariimicrobium sp. Y1814 TaxID=3418742 RepID=UPI003DA771C1